MGTPVRLSKKLLVNADDFGLSSAINEGIIKAHTDGIVRSASIVASGQAFDEALALSRLRPELGVGVHLTLVEEAAVATPRLVPTLAPKGMLPESYGKLLKGVITGVIRLSDIEREFRAQIEKCLNSGLKLTHLDSHQHTHAFPNIFALVARLGREYGITGIRIPRGYPRFGNRAADRFIGKCVLCALAHTDAILIPRPDCFTTDYFAGLFESGNLTEPAALHILRGLKAGTTELVCHPGCEDDSLKYASWNERRQRELATLISPRVKDAIERLQIELIGYRELSNESVTTAGRAA